MDRSVEVLHRNFLALLAHYGCTDGFHPLSSKRLRSVVGSAARDGKADDGEYMHGFVHFSCPSLAHFLALLCQPTAVGISPTPSLVGIDSLSALSNHAFPRVPASGFRTSAGGNKCELGVDTACMS